MQAPFIRRTDQPFPVVSPIYHSIKEGKNMGCCGGKKPKKEEKSEKKEEKKEKESCCGD